MQNVLPNAIYREIMTNGGFSEIEEIHLRADRVSTVTVRGENRRLAYRATREMLEELLLAVTGGSIYAYRDSIRRGFVTLSGGIRMGLAGRAVTEGEEVVAVTELTSVCFRLPHAVHGVAERLFQTWVAEGSREGVLVVAPPGCGKTTYLRDFIRLASSGPHARRVAVVDSREELHAEGEMVDVLTAYPRAAGLESALRTLSPQVLVSDEIGAEEIACVHDVMHCGVPLVASMHGSSLTELAKRPSVAHLLEAGVFGMAVTLTGARGGWREEVVHLSC